MNAILASAVAASAGSNAAASDAARPSLARILSAIRMHLGMDVAFISEIVGGRRFFRHVDARDPDGLVQPGHSDPVEDSYCYRVIDGRLPELMTDACLNAEALSLPATRALPVGAHLSVPIRLRDGRVYGTFCCFSHAPNSSLNERDLGMMRVFAEMVGEQIQEEFTRRDALHRMEGQLDSVLRADGLNMVFQPIYDLMDERVVGFESLARFSTEPYRTPDLWFADAARLGRGPEFELRAMQLALGALEVLATDTYVAVNASPATLIHGELDRVLSGLPLHRIVVEVTEHQAVERYEELAAVLRPLQDAGLRVAIDDAGAGYASFRHILNLRPEIVKLDASITRAIDMDRSRRALAAALRSFAHETGCSIVAEGIETPAELETLKSLGIRKAQGYHLGRPVPLPQVRAMVH